MFVVISDENLPKKSIEVRDNCTQQLGLDEGHLKNASLIGLESYPSTSEQNDINKAERPFLDTNEEERINALRIINNINNEMQPEIPVTCINGALSMPVISTPKVTFTNPSRIRIINSSELFGKTMINNVNVSKVINVSSTGERKDVIRLISGKTIRNVQALQMPPGLSPAKIIRIKSEKECERKVPYTSMNSTINKSIVTIQAGSTKTPVNLHINRNSVKLSPKTNFNVINKSTIITSNIQTSTSSGSNYILLTPSSSFTNKETTSSMLRPITNSESKIGSFERYGNQQSQRMEGNSITNSSTWQQYVRQYAHMGPCPICEDSISGYHYGIFCCESCKGFFKRSVQNHKDYVCHVQQSGGEPCGINRHTRKKCPSCRFQRCVEKGMRIEAVRNDRSRGGRSLYPGSRNRIHRYSFPPDCINDDAQKSSVTTSSSPDTSKYMGYIRQLNSNPNVSLSTALSVLPHPTTPSFEFSRNSSATSSGPLHRALSSRGRTSMMSVLDNIVVIEEQLQQERDVLGPIIEDDDMAVYRVLLKLAEQRLHRMVRWSRALPEFSAIDTDDQIMLVQNCWAELLILDCCYRSLGDPREIHLTSGKCINLEAACELGAKEIVEFILATTQKLKNLKLDIREYACLKVLLLMQPDLKHLKAEGRVRMFQETISQLLLDYTNQNFETDLTNKFYELIVCVPQIREAANSVKEMLISKDLNPFLSSNSLLLELLNCNINNNNLSSSPPLTVVSKTDTNDPSSSAVTFKPQIISKDVKIISITNKSKLYDLKSDVVVQQELKDSNIQITNNTVS